MKKITIVLLLLCNTFLSQAQSRFSAGITFGPQLSFMKITRPFTSPFVSGFKESGGVGLGYFVGAQLEYKFKKNFFVRSGLNYQNSKHQYRISELEFTDETGMATPAKFINDIQIYSFDLPLDLGYRIETSNEKVNIIVGLGGIAHFPQHIKSTGAIKQDNRVLQPLHDVDTHVTVARYSAVFIGGVEFQISKHFGLAIEPFLKSTPNKFDLSLLRSESKTRLETGLACRMRFM